MLILKITVNRRLRGIHFHSQFLKRKCLKTQLINQINRALHHLFP